MNPCHPYLLCDGSFIVAGVLLLLTIVGVISWIISKLFK